MDLAYVIAVAAVATGVAAAMIADARLWVLAPVRAFAVMAVAMAIAVHILPEAIDGGGWWVLVVAAIGLVAPIALSRVTARLGARHRRTAAELGYAAVLVHQLSDGLALGAATRRRRRDPSLGSADRHRRAHRAAHRHADAHVRRARRPPRRGAARARHARRHAGRHRADPRSTITLLPSAEPWLNAAVSGLLLHVLVHDSGDREVPAATRPLEALGVALGAALPFVTGGHEHSAITHALREILELRWSSAPRRGSSPAARSPCSPPPAIAARRQLVRHGHRPDHRARPRRRGLRRDGVDRRRRRALDRPGGGRRRDGVPRPVAIGAAIALAALTLVEIARDGLLTWLGTRHDHDHGHAHGPAHDHGHGHGHDHDHDAA
jgi:hypothetical protein